MRRVVVSVRRPGGSPGWDFDLPTDVGAAELAAQLARAFGEPAGDGPLELRLDGLHRALRPDETLADAGVWDGATIRLARHADPFDEPRTALALSHAQTGLAVLVPPPRPPVLALPGAEVRRPFPLALLIGTGVLLLAFLILILIAGVYLVRSRQSEPALVAEAPLATATTEPTLSPVTPTMLPTEIPTSMAVPSATAVAGADEDTAWRTLQAQLDQVWGDDWPAAISLLQAFHQQYPTRTAATDKLYAALVEYGRALRDAGATSAAMETFEQAVRLAPQREEAREELAALAPTPTAIPTQPPPPVAAPVFVQPTRVPPPVPTPTPVPAPPPPPPTPAPEPPAPACDVTSLDSACPLADGMGVQQTIAEPDGRHFYWFGVPSPDMHLHVEVGGPACPCTLFVFSDQVDNGATPIAQASGSDSDPAVLDQVMPDPGPFLLEVAPDQSADNGSQNVYALTFGLQPPPLPTPTPAPEVPEAPPPTPTATPVPISVPPVVARSASEAQDCLRAVGLVPRPQTADRYSPAGAGTVAAQDPPAGALLPPGASVTLWVATGDVVVPNVIGMREQDAWSALHDAGLEVDLRHAPRTDVEAGRAAVSNPPAGTVVPASSTVVLTISQGD